jgi:hypothetical protein
MKYLYLLCGLFSSVCLACSPEQIEILSFSHEVEDSCKVKPCPQYKLVGEIKNNCDTPQGAQITITARDSNGSVVDTFTGWPASTKNIPSNEAFPFNFTGLIKYNEKISSWDIKIADLKQWDN